MTDTSKEAMERLASILAEAASWGGAGLKGESGDFGKLDDAADTLCALAAERDDLQAKVERLREALEWYEENASFDKILSNNAVKADGGERARAALKETDQ